MTPTQAERTNKVSHTPTPWKTSYTIQNSKDPLFWHSGVVHGGIRVALAAGTSHDEAEANAAFIVRAVNGFEALEAENRRLLNAHEELLNEMRMAVNELGKDWQSCDTGNTGAECLGEKCFMAEHRVMCHLEQAIAKAEGRP